MRRKNFPMSQKLALLLGDVGITVLVYLFVTTVILARGSLITNFDLYQGMLPVQVILTGLLFKETLINSYVAQLCLERLQ